MFVAMVRVRHVRVLVEERRMHMSMAVRASFKIVVHVIVMPVVVRVRMLVVQRAVPVFMTMRLFKVQCDPDKHQRTSGKHDPRAAAVAECDGKGGTDERRASEHRSCACGAKSALGEQIKAQAQPIAGGTDDQQNNGCSPCGKLLTKCPG